MPECANTFNTREVAKGTILKVARQASPSTFVRIAGVVSIDGPNASREDIDGDELDPQPDTIPGGECAEMYFYKAMYPGVKEWSVMNVTLNMKWTQYKTLYDIYNRDELAWFQVVLRSGNSFKFQSYVKELNKNFETNKFVQVTMGVKPVSLVVYTDATTTTTTTTPA